MKKILHGLEPMRYEIFNPFREDNKFNHKELYDVFELCEL
jgi:hypothetical protein